MRNLSAGQTADTKHIKTNANEMSPTKVKRLSSMVSLGKSQPEKPATYCTIAQTMSGSDTTNEHSSSYQSSGSFASSNSSSSSSSSSFSSSNGDQTEAQQSQGQPTPSTADTAEGGGSSSATSASSSPYEQSTDDDKLPTNADYYPLAQSEAQSNEDYNDSEQYDVESTIDSERHKEMWANLMNAPQHIVTKLQKIHADFKGMGALYGSDHFAPQSHKAWIEGIGDNANAVWPMNSGMGWSYTLYAHILGIN